MSIKSTAIFPRKMGLYVNSSICNGVTEGVSGKCRIRTYWIRNSEGVNNGHNDCLKQGKHEIKPKLLNVYPTPLFLSFCVYLFVILFFSPFVTFYVNVYEERNFLTSWAIVGKCLIIHPKPLVTTIQEAVVLTCVNNCDVGSTAFYSYFVGIVKRE